MNDPSSGGNLEVELAFRDDRVADEQEKQKREAANDTGPFVEALH